MFRVAVAGSKNVGCLQKGNRQCLFWKDLVYPNQIVYEERLDRNTNQIFSLFVLLE